MLLQRLRRDTSRHFLGYSLIAMLIMGNPTFSRYTGSKQNPEETKVIIKQLQSDDWRVRDHAIAKVNRLPKEAITDDIKANLLQLLAREAKEDIEIRRRYWSMGVGAGEGHGEYVISFLETVLPFVDENSIPHLVQFLDWAPPIRETIVRFGEKALKPVLEKLEDISPGLRQAAVEVLGTWLRPKQEGFVIKGFEREDVKSKLTNKAQQDISPEVRMSAIKALSDSGDVRAYDLFFSDVAARLDDTKPWVREKALQILVSWLEGKVLDGDRREAAKNKIIGMALYDPTPYVRIAAVSFLAQTHDADVIPVLERIAKEDTATSWETGRTIYPVREAAAQALQQLRSK